MAKLKVPDWLTADFFKDCLETDSEQFPDSITITNHTAEPAVPVGNNYGSLMLRVKINYKKQSNVDSDEQTISLIIKAPITNVEQLSKAIPDFYLKEPKFYTEYIVETNKILKHGLVPKHYNSPNPHCVVLEDLRESGYKMIDRQKLLDFDHAQLYVKSSAKLHALSVAANKLNPKLIQSLTKVTPEMEQSMENVFKNVLKNGLECMAAYLEDKVNCKEYFDIITKLIARDKYWSMFKEIKKTDTPLKALVQNDPWCTNMMFSYYSSGKVKDIKLLDFQSLKFTSPVTEFITFLWVSVNPEVRETKINDLYHLYCDSLNSCLEELGCSERLPFELFKQELIRLSPLALMYHCFMMPLSVSEEAVDLSAFFAKTSKDVPIKESVFYKLYLGSNFSKYYQQSLKQAEREGIFNVVKRNLN